MKILVCPGDDGACSAYRAFQPYWKLGPGYEVAFTYNPKDENFATADVLVIPRIHTELALRVFKDFKASGRPVILDFDDNFHCIPWYNPARQVFHEGTPDLQRFEEALEMATLVTCSTQTLADSYKHVRDDIVVCPNFIANENLDAIAPKELTGAPKREGQIRIGYAGSHTHFGDVLLLAEPLAKIAEAYQFPRMQFVFFGYPPILPLHHRVNCEYYPGIARVQSESVNDFMLRYYREIIAMDIDIALAPLEDCLFNRCKSNIKLLEYGIAGIPVLASPIDPYKGWSLMEAQDAFSWEVLLGHLVEKQEARLAFAETNLKRVREQHTTRQAIGAWHRLLEKVAVASV